MVKFYFMTISKYGDIIGANLLRTLRKKTHNVDFYGVGGPKMGLDKVIEYEKLNDNMYLNDDCSKICCDNIGVFADIMRVKPDVIISIGNWDFCKEIYKKINNSCHCSKVIIVHYVAPNVFYKGERFIKEMSEQIDLLVSIYPQEVKCANKYKLPCTYVGHPMTEIRCVNSNLTEFYRRISLAPQQKFLTALFETNLDDVKRNLPYILEVGKAIQNRKPELTFVLLSSGKILAYIQEHVEKSQSKAIVLDEEKDLDNVISMTKVAIATSEKGTLKFSFADIPHVVAYKEPPAKRFRLGKSKHFHFLNLVNLILEKNIIPIYFNYSYNPKNIKNSVLTLLNNEEIYKNQIEAFHELKYLLLNGKKSSSENAADAILSFVRGLMCVNGSCVYL
ncbi:MAG: hypothetical protein ACK5N8_00370 [Alphaproteobacteria bacterium]